MPFTPLHMGPGLAIKAVAGRHFSLLSFGIAQVAMDIEPLVGMMRNAEVLHGPSHTYLAAAMIAILVTIISPLLARPLLARWNAEVNHYRLDWLAASADFNRSSLAVGAFTGTFSHVLLDSIMHHDIRPLLPWSSANTLQGTLSISTLETLCIVAGIAGLIVVWFRRVEYADRP